MVPLFLCRNEYEYSTTGLSATKANKVTAHGRDVLALCFPLLAIYCCRHSHHTHRLCRGFVNTVSRTIDIMLDMVYVSRSKL